MFLGCLDAAVSERAADVHDLGLAVDIPVLEREPLPGSQTYPVRRFARHAADVVPRRLALELALPTFLEASADVVGVSQSDAEE